MGIESEEVEKLRTQFQLRPVFADAPYDEPVAEHLPRQIRLWSEPITPLVEMRREGENRPLEGKVILHLSSEAKGNLNVNGRLNLPKFVKFSALYEQVVKKQYVYSLTVMARF